VQVAGYTYSLTPESHQEVRVEQHIPGFGVYGSDHPFGSPVFMLCIWWGWFIGNTIGPQYIKKHLIAELSVAIIILISFDPITLGSHPSIVIVKFRCNLI
jgi:hypothetical protein